MGNKRSFQQLSPLFLYNSPIILNYFQLIFTHLFVQFTNQISVFSSYLNLKAYSTLLLETPNQEKYGTSGPHIFFTFHLSFKFPILHLLLFFCLSYFPTCFTIKEMETSKPEGKRSINETESAEGGEDEDEDVEEDNKKKRALTLSGRKLTGGGSTQLFCQVEDCSTDMTDAKPYHRRHKVCEIHAKAPSVLINGVQQRFCQQCSRLRNLISQIFLLSHCFSVLPLIKIVTRQYIYMPIQSSKLNS